MGMNLSSGPVGIFLLLARDSCPAISLEVIPTLKMSPLLKQEGGWVRDPIPSLQSS